MADFRRWFYALAVVALLAGFTGQVRAQGTQPFQCTADAGVPPIVRVEGFTELVGDILLNCTGGTPTQPGSAVPPVNITVSLNTNITSRLLAANLYDEALLIVDDPHSAVQPARPILNCGAPGAPDTGTSGPGVCSIIATTAGPAFTYDGTPGVSNTTPSTGYGSGRPNVFQGRTGSPQNPNIYNQVSFLGVPIDPPGSTTNRTIRITNIRANAVTVGANSGFNVNTIVASISVNGNTSLSINNATQVVVGYVEHGLLAPATTSNFSFLQCVSQNALDYITGSAAHLPTQTTLPVPAFTFTEGFASSWKTKNISFVTNQAGNGIIQAGNSYWTYNTAHPTLYPTDQNQNVPGAIYNTEAGFEYPGTLADPAAPNNPPNGVGTYVVTATGSALSDATTGIAGAGIANQGTRLSLQLTTPVAGSTVLVPTEVFLTNSVGISGVMVLTSTDASGAGAYTPASATISTSSLVALPASGLIVYEILFSDPFSVESASVPVEVAYAANLAQNLPAVGATAQASGGFAPFYAASSGALNTSSGPSSTPPLPEPRFIQNTSPVNLYSISKCACDILFPYVVSAAGFDTGIAIANTSLDPGALFGFHGTAQSGAVQFWYYGNMSVPTQTTGTNTVPAGGVLTYVLSSGGGAIYGPSLPVGGGPTGLDGRAAGFIGYIIAQAQFQWCHAFAFIDALGAGPTGNGISEGYLGLILDPGGLERTTQQSENLLH